MNRFRRVVAALAILGGGANVSAMAADDPPSGRHEGAPNIVLVLADDLGWGELGCYGQEKIPTPAIDRLAAEGMRFTRFYSGAPVCAPTRCVLLTARHTGHAAIRGNSEVGGWGPEDGEGQLPLPADETTLAERLQSRGYATACIGKWGLGGPGTEGHPCNQGFDEFYGYICQRRAHNLYPSHLWRNHQVTTFADNCWFSAHQRLKEPLANESDYDRYRGGTYAPQRMLDEAVSFIDRNRDRPFFLYFASPLPHLALQAPPEWVDRFPRDWDPEPYLGQSGYLPNPRPRATYAAMIAYLDHSVGTIMDALDRAGVAEHTIVLFTSDNGTTYTGGVDRTFFDSLRELRGHKGNLWEGGIRVPLVAWWPGHVAAASSSAHPGSIQDLLPTLVEMVDGTPPDAATSLDGISLAPTLLGRPADQRAHAVLYFEYPEANQQQAVILDGRWKAIRPNLKKTPARLELYDLETDPGEQRDVAADRPDVVERARDVMATEHVPSVRFPIPALDGEGK
ncbi:MAG: arylsulfatase [Phycisphaerales bacterium]|nr:arylsulfatase [Phycisphaerales bacterium]